ncbi:hypothetical protein BC936DRAFT_144657 [Jimgerdemannia flammicorona]|uniref:Ion transport domain-containing protein n=1 Tax=Jimgerdemannia flammicorona TaxID=994334 RepID=A0A433DC12_9FUNG|nr:hypothetical protein BC936DRAFT_144657 [Jimgerdemannia flammicorona]
MSSSNSRERTPLLPSIGHHHTNTVLDTDLTNSIRNLRNYIILNVTHKTEDSDILSRNSSVVTDQFLEDAINICVDKDSVAFCALRCTQQFQEIRDEYPQWNNVFDNRALCAEVLAMRFVSKYSRRLDLFTEVLLKKRSSRDRRPKNVIELALDLHATLFLSDPEVSRCVEGLWNGAIVPIEDGKRFRFHFNEQGNDDGVPRRLVSADRLVVPKYANVIEVVLSVGFLLVYTFVVNFENTYEPTPLEWIWTDRIRYFYSLWSWVSCLIYLIFIVILTLRVYAFTIVDDNEDDKTFKLKLNNIALDLLSTLAIFLWMRLLSVLDWMRYFGTYYIILQAMFKDGIIFFLLLFWVLVGFIQAFLALRPEVAGDDFIKILKLLLTGYLTDPDFEAAAEFHPVLGQILFGFYIFITVIILQTILFSFFAASFQNVVDRSGAEYLASFTLKTLDLLEQRYYYPAPFNIVGLVVILPFRPFLSLSAYRTLHLWFTSVVFFPVLVCITWYERGPGARKIERYRFDDINESEEDDMPLNPTAEDLAIISKLLNGRLRASEAKDRAEEGTVTESGN